MYSCNVLVQVLYQVSTIIYLSLCTYSNPVWKYLYSYRRPYIECMQVLLIPFLYCGSWVAKNASAFTLSPAWLGVCCSTSITRTHDTVPVTYSNIPLLLVQLWMEIGRNWSFRRPRIVLPCCCMVLVPHGTGKPYHG